MLVPYFCHRYNFMYFTYFYVFFKYFMYVSKKKIFLSKMTKCHCCSRLKKYDQNITLCLYYIINFMIFYRILKSTLNQTILYSSYPVYHNFSSFSTNRVQYSIQNVIHRRFCLQCCRLYLPLDSTMVPCHSVSFHMQKRGEDLLSKTQEYTLL